MKDIADNYLEFLFFIRVLVGMESNKEFNGRHDMLDFPLFMEVPSEYYY